MENHWTEDSSLCRAAWRREGVRLILELLTDPNAWASLLTLTALEIVLGIDNLLFLTIVTDRLPKQQALQARRIGLGLALAGRIALLFAISWIIGITEPVVELFGEAWSWRDAILLIGGFFLLYKGTTEIHKAVEGDEEAQSRGRAGMSFAMAIVQIAVLDLIFSLDSVLTAVGMAEHLPVMIAAVTIAIAVMLVAAGPLSEFVSRHPTVKMLALSFVILVGVALIADALHFHIPRGYIYTAIAFSIMVEFLNLSAQARRKRRRQARKDAA